MEAELKHGSRMALEAIPLAQILAGAYSRNCTIVLSLKTGSVTRNIFIKDGALVFANSNDPGDSVKNFLLADKKLSQSQIDPVEKHMAENKTKFFDSMIALGYYPADKIDLLRSAHAADIVKRAHGVKEGVAEVIENDAVFSKISRLNIDMYKVTAAGIKDCMTKGQICTIMPDLDPSNFMIITEKGRNDDLLNRIPPEAKGVITIIESSPNIKEIAASSFLCDEDVFKYLYYLKIFGLVDIETPETRQGRILDRNLSGDEKKKKLGILGAFEKIKAGNCYEILGVLEDAPQNELDEAREALAKQYEPGRLRKLFWGPDKNIPDELMSKIEEAYQILSDPKKRSEYDAFLSRGEADKFAEKSSVLGSLEAAKIAGDNIAKGDYAGAVKYFEQALEHTPDDTDIICDLAGAVFMAGGSGNVKSANEATALLKKAHSIKPENYKIFLGFGRIFQSMGKPDQSLEAYKKALYLNPNSKEAEKAVKEKDEEASVAFKIRGLHNFLEKFNYYELLDIEPHSSSEEIKKAYYASTKTYHPDKHFTKDSQELKAMTNKIYKRIVEAYMVLKNQSKRKEYDNQLGEYKAQKETRLKDAADVVQRKEKQEIVFESKNAKKFFELGLTALNQKKLNAAKMNFQFALQAEPNNVHIKRKLKEIEDLEKVSGD